VKKKYSLIVVVVAGLAVGLVVGLVLVVDDDNYVDDLEEIHGSWTLLEGYPNLFVSYVISWKW
jgi:hypothetical protein